MPQAEVGVFGGSGFYSFLDDVEEVEVETPFGAPSASFTRRPRAARTTTTSQLGRVTTCPSPV